MTPGPASDQRSVAVIGAGVVGLSCALWLQRRGFAVSLVDPHPPEPGNDYTGAASFGNACTIAMGACIPVATPGVLRQVPQMLMDRESPLALYWRDLPWLVPWLTSFIRSSTPAQVSRIVSVLGDMIRHAEAAHAPLIAESRSTELVRRRACLYLYKSAQSFRAAGPDIELRRREQVAMTELGPEAIRELEPHLAPVYHRAVRFDDSYTLDNPHRYAQALLALFVERGGRLHRTRATGLTVQGVDVSIHGEGTRIAARQAVIAAGAWSRQLVRSLGDDVPLDTERGYHVLFPRDGSRLNGPCCYPEHGFYMTPLAEGLRMAGTVELGGLGKPLRPIRTRRIAAVARSLVTGLGETGREWLGFRPSMPDSLPVIGRSGVSPHVIYAFGHGHIGLTLAGITGQLVAELADNAPTSIDLSALSPGRFNARVTP